MLSAEDPDPRDLRDEKTTQLTRRAMHGDEAALAAVIERFHPLLVALARNKMTPALRRLYDVEDIVAQVWLRVLPRLSDLETRDGHLAPVVKAFLRSAFVNHYRNLVRRSLRGAEGDGDDPDGLPEEITRPLSRLVRDERHDALFHALEELPTKDREVLVLRGLELLSTREAAAALGTSPEVVSTRYGRARDRIRNHLPAELFDDLVAGAP